jgi:hypothetical protein
VGGRISSIIRRSLSELLTNKKSGSSIRNPTMTLKVTPPADHRTKYLVLSEKAQRLVSNGGFGLPFNRKDCCSYGTEHWILRTSETKSDNIVREIK